MPALQIPQSNATVSVKLINGGLFTAPSAAFWDPVVPGYEHSETVTLAFLVEHEGEGKRVMFDLGFRKDPEGWTPAAMDFVKLFTVDVKKDVVDTLKEGGVSVDQIDAVIWSHPHFDHTGDVSLFPPSTELIFGQGTKKRFFPPYPENKYSMIHESDLKGRKVTELSFDSNFSIGGFKAIDYFNDGSFYILDSPGHVPGHIAALARVTPTTFIVFGGDTCHHPGQLRPNATVGRYFPCPGSLLEKNHPNHPHDAPILQTGAVAYEDVPTARESIKTLSETFDADPDVLVIIAHDSSILDIFDMFPKTLNAWKEKGWKKPAMWAFLEEGNMENLFSPKV